MLTLRRIRYLHGTSDFWRLIVNKKNFEKEWAVNIMTVELLATQYIIGPTIRDVLQHVVYRQIIKNTDHLKEVVNNRCDMISQELINSTVRLTSGLNDCYWSFILNTDTLIIVSDNSVTSACCKLYFCQDLPWKCRRYWCFWSSSLASW